MLPWVLAMVDSHIGVLGVTLILSIHGSPTPSGLRMLGNRWRWKMSATHSYTMQFLIELQETLKHAIRRVHTTDAVAHVALTLEE